MGEKLNRTIFFIDPVEQHELLAITEKAIFGVYTAHDLNTKYCLPNKLFEFIQAETPFLYHSGLLEVTKIAEQLGGATVAASLETPQGVADGLRSMLALDLKDCKKKIAHHKQYFSWEVEEQKLLAAIRSVLDLDDITSRAVASSSSSSIKGHEFAKVVQDNPQGFYAAATGAEPLPQHIIFDFPSPTQLRKMNITWESEINYGLKYAVEYFDDEQNDFIEVAAFDNMIGMDHTLEVKTFASSKFRLMVYKVKGQQRLLIRAVKFFGHVSN